jgi:hypothetical protein
MGAVFQMIRSIRICALAAFVGLSACAQEFEFSPRFVPLMNEDAPQLQIYFPETGVTSALLLSSERAGHQTWLAADGAALILNGATLTATRGLGDGLMAVDADASLNRIRTGQPGPSTRFHTYLQADDRTRTRTYQCDVAQRGPNPLLIEGREIPTILWAEDCNSLDQSFVNLYWLDPGSGRILQFQQWVGPVTGDLLLRLPQG